MLFILAGNKTQAEMFARDNQLTHWTYVDTYERLIGSPQGSTLTLVGTFYERKDAHKIVTIAEQRAMKIERFGDLEAWVKKGLKKDE